LSVIFAFVSYPDDSERQSGAEEKKCTRDLNTKNELPSGFNDLFAGSGECVLCHNSNTNAQGESVSIVADWRSSMMAHSAKDPFWRAKVSHEGLVNPDHAEVLEDVCTKCHAPMGHFNAHHNGQELYSIEDMENDPLSMDGASCTVCHQIKSESLGNYSGNIIFGTEKIIWGPYTEPFPNPMISHTGYTPAYGEHIKDSKLCASCHTLITNSVDLNGVPTGTEFVEQAVFQEWSNSVFPGVNTTCQSCHVPEIDDVVKISTMPPWLEGRTPFGKHHLAGANVFMLKLLKQNIVELGITATETQLDSTISRAQRMLQENSIVMQLSEIQRTDETLFVDMQIENIAGHKFPTAYPSRRAFVELFVVNESEDTIFHSGKMDENYQLIYEDEGFEPHYDIIENEEQVQIYEMVMGDVSYEPTTLLERAFVHLKDNRLPPQGFSSEFYNYDTVAIYGDALLDDNFNKMNGTEGSGKDILYFHIPISGYAGELSIKANVYYQTVSEKWLENMFSYTSDEIDSFKEYFYNADREPILVASNELSSLFTNIGNKEFNKIIFYPNPAKDIVFIDNTSKIEQVTFYGMDGKRVAFVDSFDMQSNLDFLPCKTPDKKGIYLLEVKSDKGLILPGKIVIN